MDEETSEAKGRMLEAVELAAELERLRALKEYELRVRVEEEEGDLLVKSVED
jgi:hypothetical protein